MNVKLAIPSGDVYKSAEERAFAQFAAALLYDKFGSTVHLTQSQNCVIL